MKSKGLPEPPKNFGEALRAERAARMLGLREFCRRSGLDPALVSRVERGQVAPPADADTLKRFGRGLRLAQNSPEWKQLADLASLARGQVPKDLLDDDEVVDRLPVLFRALRDRKNDDKLLAELDRIIRRR